MKLSSLEANFISPCIEKITASWSDMPGIVSNRDGQEPMFTCSKPSFLWNVAKAIAIVNLVAEGKIEDETSSYRQCSHHEI